MLKLCIFNNIIIIDGTANTTLGYNTLKENISDDIVLNLPRENFFSTQTPQSFKFKEILNLHIKNKSLYKKLVVNKNF